MKTLALLLLAILAIASADNGVLLGVNEDVFINEINSAQDLWMAGKNHITAKGPNGMQRLLGLKRMSDAVKVFATNDLQMPANGIPKSFDARTQWPDCPIDAIQDQSDCGSCWAVGSTKAMADRLCIASKYKVKVNISAEQVVSCCRTCGNGCLGGDPYLAWSFFIKPGIVTGGDYRSHDGCQPYLIKPCGSDPSEGLPPCPADPPKTPACRKRCYNPKYKIRFVKDRHHGNSAYFLTNVTAMQIDVMTNGPIVAGYTVYSDFFHYKSGVYKHTRGKKEGEHAVRVIGWGVQKRKPYWLVANSWRRHWGDNGYFKILRGKNECDFESYVTAGLVTPK